MPTVHSDLYIGLMSGTSLDGVDGVLAAFPAEGSATPIKTIATAYVPFPESLREELMSLQTPGMDEVHREACAANTLARLYAECVERVLEGSGTTPRAVRAIGAHGQTIRHRPELGYTRQTNNPALLAELSGIDVIADFRSRDIAAGGQGAPLVPAFHRAVFGDTGESLVIANIGGISNISVLKANQQVIGFDTGPGNVLMDAWIARHKGAAYDKEGAWAASGIVSAPLLNALCNEPFFALPPPKSTGRDLFHPAWLESKLSGTAIEQPENVQATLAEFTARTLADAIVAHAANSTAVYVCGGGAYNIDLMHRLQEALARQDHPAKVRSTDMLGIAPNHVEALAFAWLAYRHVNRRAGNLATVTGAKGERILGSLHPA